MINKFLQHKESIALFRLNRLALAVLFVIGFPLTPLFGYAAPVAITQVSKFSEVQAGGYYDIDQAGNVPQPYPQFTASDISVAGTLVYTDKASSANAQGSASAEFGPGIPQVGITSVTAKATSIYGTSKANFNATVQYFIEIRLIKTVPDTTPSTLPVLFGARGEGFASVVGVSDEGYGGGLARSTLYVDIYGTGLLTETEFKIDLYQSGEGNMTDNFDDTKSLNLYLNSTYSVIMTASCQTFATFGSAGGLATGSVWGDPFISFDQTTFDTLMGTNTYNLNDYYNIAFSENVVPIPTSIWLLGSGLIGLVGLGRKKRNNSIEI